MRKPCAAPNNPPATTSIGMTTHGFQPSFVNAAAAIVVSARTEPTDRSMPPVRITNVMPIATIARKALSIARLRKTCGARKESYCAAPYTTSAMNSTRVATSGTMRRSRPNRVAAPVLTSCRRARGELEHARAEFGGLQQHHHEDERGLEDHVHLGRHAERVDGR